MKRVIIISSNVMLPGGTERAISNTINLLHGEDVEIEVMSLSSSDADTPYFDINAPIHNIGLPPLEVSILRKIRWYYLAVKKVNNFFKIYRTPDYIFGYGHNVSIMLPFINAGNCKRYACEHINYLSIPRSSRILMRAIYPFLNGVIALSKTAKDKLVNLNRFIEIIPNSISFPPIPHLVEKTKTIIMVGRISAEKGYERLVPIAKVLKANFTDWHIEIWGDGPDYEKIKELYHNEAIDDYVLLKGATKNIQKVYQDASILIMTSYTEALPMVIIEAKANGVPTIAYECEGTSELIVNGVDGKVIKNNDYHAFYNAMAEIMSDSEIYRRYANNALTNSSEFSNLTIKNKWLNFLK